MEQTIQNTLFREKPLKIFMLIEKYKISAEVSRKSKCTYSHTTKIINTYCAQNLITRNKVGRVVELSYTKKGEELLNILKTL